MPKPSEASSRATSTAAGAAPFMYYIDPDIPHNQGAIDHIRVVLKEGTICFAKYPASTSAATIVPSDMMSDSINKALSQALPDRVLGGTARCANVPQFSGESGHDGEPWGVMMFNNTGASGAAADADGWPLFESNAAFGGLKAQSVEQLEMLYPLIVDQLEVETDSVGHGRHIGGPGVRMAIRTSNGEMECITFGDGAQNPPHGVAGGMQGSGGGQYVENLQTGHRRFFSASGQVRVRPAERHVGVSTGGGGNGDPKEREIERVRRNVRDGWIARETARRVYGVVLGDERDPIVDEAATAQLRASMPARDASVVEPLVPSASTWLAEQMSDGDTYLLNPVE